MEVTRKHLVGLEMALDSWNDGGPSVQFAAHLADLIAQAKAAPIVPYIDQQVYKDSLVDFVLPNGDEGYDLTEASLKRLKGEK